MAMNGPSARALHAWSARANSSLPVPLSPSSSTVTSVAAARCIVWMALSSAGASPMMRGAPRRSATSCFRRSCSRTSRCCATARPTTSCRWSGSTGLARKSRAPSLHRRDGVLHAAVGGHDDHGNRGVDGLHRAQHAEAVAGRQPQVGDDDGRRVAGQHRLGFGLVAGLDHADGRATRAPAAASCAASRDPRRRGRPARRVAPARRVTSFSGASRPARPPCGLVLDGGDRLGLRRDLALHALELGDRLRAVLSDDGSLRRIVAVDEVGGQGADRASAALRRTSSTRSSCSRAAVMRPFQYAWSRASAPAAGAAAASAGVGRRAAAACVRRSARRRDGRSRGRRARRDVGA